MKNSEIKETATDAVDIIRKLGSPEVQDSLGRIRDTPETAKGNMESLKTPGMVRNVENIRMIAEAVQNMTARMKAFTSELVRTGIIDEGKEAIKSARITIN